MAEMKYPSSIAAALHQVMTRIGYVQKKGTNDFQKYKYAGEAHVLEALRPEMVEAGIILIPSGKHRSAIDEHGITHVEVEYTLLHKDGSVWPEKIIAYGDGGDKNSKGVGDKGLYKALTGANKYLLFKLFQLETGDADPEAESEHDKEDAAPQSNTTAAKSTGKLANDKAPAAVAIKAKSPSEWAEKFKATASVAPDIESLTAFEKVNHDWLSKLPKDLYDTCADSLSKRMAFLSQEPHREAAE